MYLMQLEFDHVEMQNEVSYGKVRPATFAVSFLKREIVVMETSSEEVYVCVSFLKCGSSTNKQVLEQIKPELSLEAKMKLSYFGHLMRSQGSLEKAVMLEKAEGSRKRGRTNMRWIDSWKEPQACVDKC